MKYAILFIVAVIGGFIGYYLHKLNTDDLILKKRGSFYIGGEKVAQDFVELGSFRADDTVTINQMYVEYMISKNSSHTPLILVHGAGLSGSCYDTTPDGRMGWFEYFVRKSYPTYVVDQVGRGRSGFNQAIFNNVGAGREDISKQPKILRMADLHSCWINFRIGPKAGEAFKGTQFPIEATEEFSRFSIADLSASLDSPNPNYKSLADLAQKLGGAVLIGHSQSGHYPLESALLNTNDIKAMILLEPGTCVPQNWTDEQLSIFSKIPLLVVYGDHLEGSTEGAAISWQERFDTCNELIKKINAKGGNAKMLYLPEKGLHGNTHMFMLDKNNLDIADLILDWLKENNL